MLLEGEFRIPRDEDEDHGDSLQVTQRHWWMRGVGGKKEELVPPKKQKEDAFYCFKYLPVSVYGSLACMNL